VRLSLVGDQHPIEPGDEGGPLPPIVTFQGREIRWTDWTETLPITHYKAACEKCGHDQGHEWISFGVLIPAPGDTFTSPEIVQTRRSNREYVKDVSRRAWPVHRLAAFRCPPCRTLRVYDTGTDGKQWTQLEVDEPSLFADFEFGEGRPHIPLPHDGRGGPR
jgi:hypothetical protein